MLLYYVRHGDPIYNPDSLTELGKAQAEALKHRFAAYGLDRIYSSTSNRAYQTALPTANILKKEITQLDWCNEGKAFAEFTATDPSGAKAWHFWYPESRKVFLSKEIRELGERWYDHPYFKDTPCKSGVERINREVDAFFSELGYEHDREQGVFIPTKPNDMRIALFAHEGFGMSFFSSVLDIPYPLFCTRFGIGHSSVTVIELDDHFGVGYCVPTVLQFGNDSHLYADRLPTKFHNRIYL